MQIYVHMSTFQFMELFTTAFVVYVFPLIRFAKSVFPSRASLTFKGTSFHKDKKELLLHWLLFYVTRMSSKHMWFSILTLACAFHALLNSFPTFMPLDVCFRILPFALLCNHWYYLYTYTLAQSEFYPFLYISGWHTLGFQEVFAAYLTRFTLPLRQAHILFGL